MTAVYRYYGRLYLSRPRELLWAGLAGLAGAQIVLGLAGAARHGVDNSYTRMLVTTCRRIFDEVAWLHEAYLDGPQTAVDLAARADRAARMPHRTAEAPPATGETVPTGDPLSDPTGERTDAVWTDIWSKIASGRAYTVAEGNRRLLAREQRVAQAGYDPLRDEVRAASRYVRAVHPNHGDFPGDDIGDWAQRWAWTAEMWDGWVALPVDERIRLVRERLSIP